MIEIDGGRNTSEAGIIIRGKSDVRRVSFRDDGAGGTAKILTEGARL